MRPIAGVEVGVREDGGYGGGGGWWTVTLREAEIFPKTAATNCVSGLM